MSVVNVKESIELLKKAQQIDRELYMALEAQKEIPEQKARLKIEMEAEKARLNELEAAFKKLQLRQKEKEGELAQKEQNIKKFEGQLAQVKTNKEYSAIQQEIGALKADNSLLEEDILKAFDEVETAEKDVKQERERLKEVEKAYQLKENELNQTEKAMIQKAEEMRNLRKEMIQQVAPDVRSLYDLIVQKKHGLALVKVEGETCGACQLQLRPQLINEIRMAQALIICENCSRILYFEE